MAFEPQKTALGEAGVRLHNVTILVCSTCRNEEDEASTPTPGAELYAATCRAEKGLKGKSPISVTSVECLGNCKRRLSAAIVAEQCWSYIFGDLSMENADDLLTGALLMSRSENGLMPWQGRPQCLKSGMIARLPPLFFSPSPLRGEGRERREPDEQ